MLPTARDDDDVGNGVSDKYFIKSDSGENVFGLEMINVDQHDSLLFLKTLKALDRETKVLNTDYVMKCIFADFSLYFSISHYLSFARIIFVCNPNIFVTFLLGFLLAECNST